MAAINLMTIPEFSAHLGYGRTYAYQLQKEGRLVMAEDGKRVLVAESVALIEATKDPSKQGVSARHSSERTSKSGTPPSGVPTALEGADIIDPDLDEETGPVNSGSYNFQVSKAKREHFAAMEAEASFRARVKELLEASEVKAVMAETITILRVAIEGIAHRLAPALAAEVDEGEVRALLDAEIRHALTTASESLSKVGR